MIAMLLVLVSLIMVYLRLEIGRAPVSARERWLVNIPFSIYLGWITVATIANATVVLYNAAWDGFGIAAQVWAVVMLVIGAVVTGLVIISRRDIAYTAVIVWAFAGIVVKQAAETSVATTAGVMAAAVVVVLVIKLVLDRGSKSGLTPGRA